MRKSIFILSIFTVLFLLNGCVEKEPEITPLSIVDMFDNKGNYYLLYQIEFSELTKESTVLENAFIDVPNTEVFIIGDMSEYSLDSLLSSERIQLPLKLVEGNVYHITFSTKNKSVYSATQLTLEFNNYTYIFERLFRNEND